MALFIKPMAELKEAFVQARLAEEQYFGHRHVERWLERQQRTGRIVHPEQWNRCFCRDAVLFAAAGRELEVLRQFADSSATIPRGPEEYADEVRHRKRIAPLLEAIACANTEIYYGDVHGLIVVCGGNGPGASAFVFVEDHDANGKKFTAIKPLHSVFVMDAVFATWKRGGPNAEAARTFLCDTVAGLIRKDRVEADADFDRAVAVSADGRKIVHADWVVVRDLEGSLLEAPSGPTAVFPASSFQMKKLLRGRVRRTETVFGGGPLTPQTVVRVVRDQALPHVRLYPGEQLLVVVKSANGAGGHTKIFCTPPTEVLT
ncbi:hypothetical protein HYW67_01115 [Candidatus Parcubacteria bacterium]|nr:hypothetical protein [Candidatus Parcubacteria bacterium]